MGLRLARYNLLLQHQYDLPVLSVLVLLRREADNPSMRGVWRSQEPTGQARHTFEYPVVRVWTEPARRFLDGPLGLVPLAPLADVSTSRIAEIVRATLRRISDDAPFSDTSILDVGTYILMGLKYPSQVVDQLFPGISTMRESSTYMAILNEGEARGRTEGRAEEAKNLLILMGTAKFGEPDPAIRSAIERIDNIERLERMGPRLFSVSTWTDLLATT
ncbi:MAG: hypothetical protein ACKVVP_20060 [Chloroflexota bacterium]